MGIHSTPKATEMAAAPPNPPVQASSGPIPPLPATYTSAGTAAAASGETATLENPREMRMAGDTGLPANIPSSGAARGAAPAVSVGNPEPALPPATTANLSTPASTGLGKPAPASPAPGGSAANIRTYEEAQQFLKQHRVSWQRLDMMDGQWKFECGIPNASNTHMNRHYATTRGFPDELSALREVIAQIEQASH